MRNKTVFTGQQLSITQQGDEVLITARYNGQDLRQTINAFPPCVILFDPVNLNFEAHHIEAAGDREYVGIIDSVIETAAQR